MQRYIPLATLSVISLFAIAPAWSQQIQQPTPLTTSPANQANGIGPRLQQAQPTTSTEIPSSLDQRPPSSSPIPSTGPAKIMAPEPATSQIDLAKPIQPKRVLDATGKPVDGTIQIAPDRVYDPATGEFYWTTPSGQPK